MKHTVLISCMSLSALLLVFQSCTDKDLGPISLQEYAAEDFDQIDIAGLGDVVLHDGNAFKVEIETHQEVHDHLDVRVNNGVLKIDLTKNFNGNGIDRLDIDITAPLYRGIELSGVANISSSDGIVTDQLTVENTGVGNISVRNIDVEEIDVVLDGVGDIELAGEANIGDVLVKDVGNINAFDLMLSECTARLTGVGNIRVHVTDLLDATLSGVGDIVYMGDPTVVSDVTGEGQVRKK